MQSNIPEYVMARPELVVGLTLVILAVVAWQRTLSYPEYRTAHLIKSLLFAVADGWATNRGRPLLRAKHPPDQSDEFVATVDLTPTHTYQTLRRAGFAGHLVGTTKVRTGEWAHAQMLFVHDDGQQTEVYLFPNADGGTDVYAHVETVVTNPMGHLTDAQTAGDARGVVSKVFNLNPEVDRDG